MSNKLYEKHLRTTAEESANITREIAIGFAEWINKTEINGMSYTHSRDNIWHGYYNPDKRDYNPLTTEELFDKYIESLK